MVRPIASTASATRTPGSSRASSIDERRTTNHRTAVYIELHAASAFSFLQGASLPETLVERAAALGYPALALLDADGVYGAPRFHKAAKAVGIRPIIGAELTIAAESTKSEVRSTSDSDFSDSDFRLRTSYFLLPVLCES